MTYFSKKKISKEDIETLKLLKNFINNHQL